MSQNSSNADIINNTKLEYEQALKKSWHTTKLTYTPPNHQQNNLRTTKQRKITWINPPFNLDISTNVAKIFLNLIENHFTRSSKLHKSLKKSTVKRLSSVTAEFRQIVPSMVVAERKAWYTNVQQQPVTKKTYISWIDWRRVRKTKVLWPCQIF